MKHIETTLARSLFNCDELYVSFFFLIRDNFAASEKHALTINASAAYAGTALAFRDRLVIEWNKTQQRHTFADQKRVYCMWPCFNYTSVLRLIFFLF